MIVSFVLVLIIVLGACAFALAKPEAQLVREIGRAFMWAGIVVLVVTLVTSAGAGHWPSIVVK